MLRLSALLVSSAISAFTLFAQTADIVVFSEAGEKFTLVIDGEEKNTTPATRVIATGIRNSTPLVLVRFADAGVAPLKQNGWMEAGQEYTIKITTNKKGERVFRMQGTAPLGTASGAPSEKVKPTQFVEDGAVAAPVSDEQLVIEPGNVRTTTTVTETTGSDGNVTINMNVPGMQFNMDVKDPGAAQNSTTTRTTTTTSAYTSSSSFSNNGNTRSPGERPRPVREPEVYRMPGYSGPVGCAQAPMSDAEFSAIKTNIADKNFEDTKVSTAKTIAAGRCFTAGQVREVLTVFNFEDSKLDFAKFAYDRTHDIGNYFKVNDVFNFESSVDDLNQYIRSR